MEFKIFVNAEILGIMINIIPFYIQKFYETVDKFLELFYTTLVIAMKKNSKLEGCYKRVPVAVKELINASRRHFGAIFKKVSIPFQGILIRVEPRV